MRALVTGAAGFVGAHLLRLLRAKGHDAHALVLPHENLAVDLAAVPRHPASVTDMESFAAVLREVTPDGIYHLAAVSRPSDCRDKPLLAWEVNFVGTQNLCKLASDICPKARVLFVGSAVEYGRPPGNKPLDEETRLDPRDVYASTKAAGDLLSEEYSRAGKLAIVRARPFNHTGPGQELGFVAPDFARQIARIERGLQEPKMTVGNLAGARDFCDVRDVVRAYLLLMEKGTPGAAYNICSGKAMTIRELLDLLLSMSAAKPEVVSAAGRGPKGEPDVFIGSADALRSATGWKPEIPLKQTLLDLLNDWRERVARDKQA